MTVLAVFMGFGSLKSILPLPLLVPTKYSTMRQPWRFLTGFGGVGGHGGFGS